MDIMSLFLHLLNISISASVFALAIILFRFIFKKSPKWLVVALWALVAIRLICPFSIESALSLIPSKEAIPQEIFTINTATDMINNTSFGLVDNPAYSEYFNSTVTVDNVKAFQRDFRFAADIWLIGVGIMLLYALISYIRLRHTVRTAIPLRENVWLCDSVKSPFILGVFRPRIYLPSDMDEDTAELVLRHERAHLKRKDHLWKPLGFVLLAVYWFNPVLWLSYILLCRDIELACDEKVIRDMEGTDKKAYSEALLSCSVGHRMISACPVAFGEVGVKKRIKSVLNYKKPAFWFIVVAVVVSIVLALCFMTDPKGENGGNDYINGIDEISELKFSDLNEVIFSASSYKIYHGTSTVDDYFEAKIEDVFSHSEVSSFLNTLTLGRLADGVVNPMHEPQTNGSIDINYGSEWKIRILFHDNFQKMYMIKFKADGTSVRSKDYAVLEVEQARTFFTERPYMSHALVWEFNLASSAWGNYAINIYVGEKYKINGEVTGEGNIARITDEEKGLEGISWSPLFVENPGVYNIEIPVICDGEEKVFNLTISMVGKKALSTYYTLRADDLVIASYPNGYSFELSEAENGSKELSITELDSGISDVNKFLDNLAQFLVVKNGKTVFESTNFTESGLLLKFFENLKFSDGFYAHRSAEDLNDLMEYQLAVSYPDSAMGNVICFNESCNEMWFIGEKEESIPIFEVKNSEEVKAFFENEEYRSDALWSYNPFAGGTWWYMTEYFLPEDYEIESAEASNGAIQVENRFYGDDDGEKKVIWTPDFYENDTPPAETDIVITAVKDGKEVQFKLKVTLVSGAEGYALNTFKITPVNCKLTEEAWATYLLEEK